MRRLPIIFILIAFALPTAYAQENKPLSDFHSSIIKKSKKNNEAPSPSIIASQNPHVKPYAAIVQAAKWPTVNIPVCWENSG
jgi:hypothetical protein